MNYKIAKENRLGIPLLIARDVIHGFKTMFPIPLGQAASFNGNED
jgi:beta-glucosidase